jgi:hypothetical protein
MDIFVEVRLHSVILSSFSSFTQRGKAHRLGGGFFPLTGVAVSYAIQFSAL